MPTPLGTLAFPTAMLNEGGCRIRGQVPVLSVEMSGGGKSVPHSLG
jgi:hypothetical protein